MKILLKGRGISKRKGSNVIVKGQGGFGGVGRIMHKAELIGEDL